MHEDQLGCNKTSINVALSTSAIPAAMDDLTRLLKSPPAPVFMSDASRDSPPPRLKRSASLAASLVFGVEPVPEVIRGPPSPERRAKKSKDIRPDEDISAVAAAVGIAVSAISDRADVLEGRHKVDTARLDEVRLDIGELRTSRRSMVLCRTSCF